MKTLILLGVSLLLVSGSASAGAGARDPCALHPTHSGWRVFVDYHDGFCFEYPPRYRRAPAVFAPGYMPAPHIRFIARLTTQPSPYLGATSANPKVATIDVMDQGVPFHPQDLAQFAPTDGMRPQLIRAAHRDFYLFGPGGGGVQYPDSFYFAIRGRTFSIDFYGPYSNDKTPNFVTKKIEPQVLASFRTF